MSRTPRRRATQRLQVLSVTLMAEAATTLLVWGAAASAQEPGEATSCPVVAAAQGVRATAQKAGDVALATPTGADVPAAQACVNFALSESTAYASAAYPGETVRTAPGGSADFPAYVSSSQPSQPSADAEEGTISLHARSRPTTSFASARSAPPSTGSGAADAEAAANATVAPATGTATATATSVSTPMEFGRVLLLGQARSHAEARRRADGSLQRASSLELGRSTVAGQVVTIGPDGVHALGQVAPLPADDGVADVLQSAGVTVSYLSEQRTTNGVLSPGLLVRVERQDTSGALTTVEYVIGRAFAATAPLRPEPDSASAPTMAPGPTGNVDVPSTDATSGVGVVEPSEQTPNDGAAPQLPPGPTTEAIATTSRSLAVTGLGFSFAGIYVVLVVGGLVLLASGTLLRLFGVRTRWIS